MNLIENIVTVLNNRIFSTVLTDGIFDGAKVYGLASLGIPSKDVPSRPYIWDNGDSVLVDVNDNFPAIVYHRNTGVTMTKDENSGWGNNDGYVTAVFDMLMVFYGNPVFVKYTNTDMILKLSTGLNYMLNSGDLTASGLSSVRASVVRANPNSLQVFSGEYGATADCPLQFNSVYVGVNYQLEIKATSDCLSCISNT